MQDYLVGGLYNCDCDGLLTTELPCFDVGEQIEIVVGGYQISGQSVVYFLFRSCSGGR